MIENFQNFTLILLYGGLIIMAFTIVLNPMKVNKKANFTFSLFLFLWSSFWMLDILKICGFLPSPVLIFFVYLVQIFTPIFLFYSTIFFINPNYNFKKIDLVCLVVPSIYLILLLCSENNKTIRIADFITIFHNLPYIIIIYFRIKKYQKRIEKISSNIENINLEWLAKLSLLLLGIIIITVGYELFNVFIYKFHQHLVMDLLYLFIIYSASFQVLRQKEVYPVNEKERAQLLSLKFENEIHVGKKKLISEQDFQSLKSKLLAIMNTDKPYLDGELNLVKLSELIGINPHQLSYLLNHGFNENFYQFVNKYRVDFAKNILMNQKQKKISMLEIAFEAGFNSKTTFNTIFKKTTELTPSEFRKKYSKL